jgi:hypothetical protein
MILSLLAVAAGAATASSAPAPGPRPVTCLAAQQALSDQIAISDRPVAFNPEPPSSLGRQFLQINDRLAAAMKAEDPDLQKIEALWREADQVKLEITKRYIVNRTQCTLDLIRQMPAEKRRTALRDFAPLGSEERAKLSTVRPVPPPMVPPPPPHR